MKKPKQVVVYRYFLKMDLGEKFKSLWKKIYNYEKIKLAKRV